MEEARGSFHWPQLLTIKLSIIAQNLMSTSPLASWFSPRRYHVDNPDESVDSVLEDSFEDIEPSSDEFDHGQIQSILDRVGGVAPLEAFLREMAKSKVTCSPISLPA